MDLMTTSYYVVQKDGLQKPVIRFYCRDKNKNRRIIELTNFPPWFYAPFSEVSNATDMVLDVFNRPVAQVRTPTPGDVPHMRRMFSFTDEADVRYEYRALVDLKIYDALIKNEKGDLIPSESSHIPMRIGFADIEVASPVEILPKPDENQTTYPVTSFQVKDSYTGKKVVLLLKNTSSLPADTVLEHRGKKFIVKHGLMPEGVMSLLLEENDGVIVYCDEEKHLFTGINWLIDYFEFDVLAGWYWNQFDMPYLYFRSMTLGLKLPWFKQKPRKLERGKWSVHAHGIESLDLLELYIVFTKPEGQKASYDLKFTVKEESHGEFQYVDIGDRIQEFWDGKHEELIKYCMDDTEALEIIDNARHIIKYFDGVRRKIGCPLSEAHQRNKVVKYVLLREGGKPIPTRVKVETKDEEDLLGALVDEPVIGIHSNVCILDIKSMYPAIMMSLNISKEMKSPEGTLVAANGVRFKKSPKGILTRVIEKLIKEKENLDARLKLLDPDDVEYDYLNTERETTKYTLNAIYGVQAWNLFELHDKDCGNAVTSTGRDIKRLLRTYLESLGYKVLYGDTDSVHVKCKTEDMNEGYEIQRIAQQFLDDLCKERNYLTRIEIEYDKFFERVIYVVKKRYAGLVTLYKKKTTRKVMIYGLAAKRSDSATLTIKVMDEFLDAVLLENNPDKAFLVVQDAVMAFDDYPLSEIGVPKGLSKDVYEGKFAWKIGAEWSTKNLHIRFREDQKPRLIYGHIKDLPYTDYFCIRDEEDDYLKPRVRLNKEKMLSVVLYKKLDTLLNALGYNKEDIFTKRTQLVDGPVTIKLKISYKKKKKVVESNADLGKWCQ